MIDEGHGFTSHPKVCKKYIEIIADTKGNRTYLTRKCRDGLFWDQYKTTCRRPEDVNCPNGTKT
ncbi:hypothetical protein DPMN_031317 [Dreissena polymorpha]|uniref:Chitin-binding type-2 domain-containing protein n=1 Tax=Dreissena polymorpha TaxID=45954 RepID=A0A9D4LZR4_DREPO|nr:hypothetical protein DPMN_031317 [Dreissena polymorpha]